MSHTPSQESTGGVVLTVGGVLALAVGVLWYLTTGALWQFIPIGGAFGIGWFIRRTLNKS